MAPAIVVATLQSAVLTLCSLLIARFLTSSPPPDIPSLLLYTLISTPPNYLWQQYIESRFPGYTLKKVEVDDGGKGVEVEKKLNPRNTLVKIGLDQTIGAVVNVAAYIGGTRALRGVPLGVCWDVVKEVCSSRKEVFHVGGTLKSHAANMAYNEGGIQALAGCEPDTARIHTGGEEDGRRKLSRIGVGSVSGTLCCMIICITARGTLKQLQDLISRQATIPCSLVIVSIFC